MLSERNTDPAEMNCHKGRDSYSYMAEAFKSAVLLRFLTEGL